MVGAYDWKGSLSCMAVAVALIIIFCVGAPLYFGTCTFRSGGRLAFGSNPLHDGIAGKGNSDDRRVNGG